MPGNDGSTVIRGRSRSLDLRTWGWIGLIIIAFATGLAAVIVAAHRSLSPLEWTLFEILIAVFGFTGSFGVGRRLASAPNARSAFRRVVSIFWALGAIREHVSERRSFFQAVADEHDGQISLEHVDMALATVDALLAMQTQTADDAIEDWRDLAPAEVTELVNRLNARRARSANE